GIVLGVEPGGSGRRCLPWSHMLSLVSAMRRTPHTGQYLQVRNRIYKHVFDQSWIAIQMPDAEVRRQREAYWRGVLRPACTAAVAIMIMAGLSILAFYERDFAIHQEAIAILQTQHAKSATAQRGEALRQAVNARDRAEFEAKRARNAEQQAKIALA